MLRVTDAVVEFRETLLGDVAASFEFEGPADPADIAALEDAIGVPVPTDLRELWDVSCDTYWTFSQVLYDPRTAILHSQIFNEEILGPDPDHPIRRVICFGDHIGDGICYVLDGPIVGQIMWIDPADSENDKALGDSLAEYLSTVVALAKAGQLTVVTDFEGTQRERLVPRWVSGFGSYLDVPEELQAQLNIGPKFC